MAILKNKGNTIKTSVIISVYKDTQALKLILKSLIPQTNENIQIVVSEDGNSKQMQNLLINYPKITQGLVNFREGFFLN